MEMYASGIPAASAIIGTAHRPNSLSCIDILADANVGLRRHVTILRGKPIAMINFDTIPVATTPACGDHTSTARSTNLRPLPVGNVDPIMEAPNSEVSVAKA